VKYGRASKSGKRIREQNHQPGGHGPAAEEYSAKRVTVAKRQEVEGDSQGEIAQGQVRIIKGIERLKRGVWVRKVEALHLVFNGGRVFYPSMHRGGCWKFHSVPPPEGRTRIKPEKKTVKIAELKSHRASEGLNAWPLRAPVQTREN